MLYLFISYGTELIVYKDHTKIKKKLKKTIKSKLKKLKEK